MGIEFVGSVDLGVCYQVAHLIAILHCGRVSFNARDNCITYGVSKIAMRNCYDKYNLLILHAIRLNLWKLRWC